MHCNVCQNTSKELFNTNVLQKYLIHYYKCSSCGFIQTDKPFWLDEAYESTITSQDVGLVHRNMIFSGVVEKIILKYFEYTSKFLDYAGGYGLFVRIMRDKGFDFYRQDPFCENIFAKNLDVENLPDSVKFELVTAFEVFEHWADPLPELEKILSYTDSILFSTEVQPDKPLHSVDDWWYFMPETGQHVSFYTIDSLKIIASKYKKKLYTNGVNLHLFTSKDLKENPIKENPFLPETSAFIGMRSLFQRAIKRILRIKDKSSTGEPIIAMKCLIQKDSDDAKERRLNQDN